ncbi:MAG: hypothetical protein HYW01_08005 [Deltaproteobacteria bacterium]|nr:hypothetical protein [Deltaproteobacteria bacterium]
MTAKEKPKQHSLICHSEPCPEPFGGACTERIEVLRVNSGEGAVRNLVGFRMTRGTVE